MSSSLITELPPLHWRSQDVNWAMEEADLQNVNVVLMLEDFYLLGEEGCAFLSFSLWVWNQRLIRLCYTWPHQMLTLRDSLSLYRVHHPPVFLCVCFFFWYQGDLVTRFSTDAFITLKWVSYFQSSPSSIFFAFALTTRSIVGVRCLCKRAKGRQKGHESKNLGSHLLGTHLLGHPKQNGVLTQHEIPPRFVFALCHECAQHPPVKFGESLHGVTTAGKGKQNKNPLNARASNHGFLWLWVQC